VEKNGKMKKDVIPTTLRNMNISAIASMTMTTVGMGNPADAATAILPMIIVMRTIMSTAAVIIMRAVAADMITITQKPSAGRIFCYTLREL